MVSIAWDIGHSHTFLVAALAAAAAASATLFIVRRQSVSMNCITCRACNGKHSGPIGTQSRIRSPPRVSSSEHVDQDFSTPVKLCENPKQVIDVIRMGTLDSPSPLKASRSGVLHKVDPYSPLKRAGYLQWEDYFMAVAFLSSMRSKDPNRQVGACIVGSDRIIRGIGYNGFPRGCADDSLPWAKLASDDDPLKTKYPYVCHAEMNAILNKNHASLVGASIYVTMYPCNECAKLIIQAGLTRVVYYRGKLGDGKVDPSYSASSRMFELACVEVVQHQPTTNITILFE
mmetsp:Transcript_30705/g.59234  ORF Transcript_30705/g.59234 Transcript_30705/m.59234 type:complete len:287 (-) Transcript_30705:303-1163(-)|eukprot:CAMPEP_0114225682 /NCGR_PEP_ID=MMETSP0058-20121206/808_1 /TAXON_ID=36894 /ORGANISM="Pyramimonas parkeae, CCMP726" /LENGTH=286 /DNA_ID=CAMNT_0001336315 /DNA_START=237 /DNA_END=1097 /DNA_ORIENTATION=+